MENHLCGCRRRQTVVFDVVAIPIPFISLLLPPPTSLDSRRNEKTDCGETLLMTEKTDDAQNEQFLFFFLSCYIVRFW